MSHLDQTDNGGDRPKVRNLPLGWSAEAQPRFVISDDALLIRHSLPEAEEYISLGEAILFALYGVWLKSINDDPLNLLWFEQRATDRSLLHQLAKDRKAALSSDKREMLAKQEQDILDRFYNDLNGAALKGEVTFKGVKTHDIGFAGINQLSNSLETIDPCYFHPPKLFDFECNRIHIDLNLADTQTVSLDRRSVSFETLVAQGPAAAERAGVFEWDRVFVRCGSFSEWLNRAYPKAKGEFTLRASETQEDSVKRWLTDLMANNPFDPISKENAKQLGGKEGTPSISEKAFNRAWAFAVRSARTPSWSVSGRRRSVSWFDEATCSRIG